MHYAHSPEKVWDSISDGKAISDWFIKADFKAEMGYQYTFTHEDTIINGEVKEVNRPKKLAYTWIIKGVGIETLVEWILEEKDGGTELTIVHSGFDKYSDEKRESVFSAHSGGWEHQLSSLAKFLG